MDFSGIGDFLSGILNAVLSVLPDSPFQGILNNSAVADVLGYVNYFIPVDFMLGVFQTWLVAVGVFYLWSILLRWIRAIE